MNFRPLFPLAILVCFSLPACAASSARPAIEAAHVRMDAAFYGTQFMQDAQGEFVPQPMEDEKNVGARRKAVGLEPLAEYKTMIEKMYRFGAH